MNVDPLVGRHCHIRPIEPPDYEWVFHVGCVNRVGDRWRFYGETPTFDQFTHVLLEGARATYVIASNDDPHRRLGAVQLLHYEALSRTGHLSAFVADEYWEKGWPLEGVVLFIRHMFEAYDLRKMYLESLESSAKTYASLEGRLLVQEGRLVDHRYVLGRHEDLIIYALYRETFFATLETFMPASTPADQP